MVIEQLGDQTDGRKLDAASVDGWMDGTSVDEWMALPAGGAEGD